MLQPTGIHLIDNAPITFSTCLPLCPAMMALHSPSISAGGLIETGCWCSAGGTARPSRGRHGAVNLWITYWPRSATTPVSDVATELAWESVSGQHHDQLRGLGDPFAELAGATERRGGFRCAVAATECVLRGVGAAALLADGG